MNYADIFESEQPVSGVISYLTECESIINSLTESEQEFMYDILTESKIGNVIDNIQSIINKAKTKFGDEMRPVEDTLFMLAGFKIFVDDIKKIDKNSVKRISMIFGKKEFRDPTRIIKVAVGKKDIVNTAADLIVKNKVLPDRIDIKKAGEWVTKIKSAFYKWEKELIPFVKKAEKNLKDAKEHRNVTIKDIADLVIASKT